MMSEMRIASDTVNTAGPCDTVLYKFAGPNERGPPGAGALCVLLGFLGAMTRAVRRPQVTQWIENILPPSDLDRRLKSALLNFSQSGRALEVEQKKFIALTWFETERRQGRPVWGDPRPSDIAGALCRLMITADQCNQAIQEICEAALIDAERRDVVSRQLAERRATFIARKHMIVRRDGQNTLKADAERNEDTP